MQALFAKKLVQNPPVGGDRYDLPRNELAGRLQGALGGIFQPAAAGHLHAHNGDLLNVVAADDGGQLLAESTSSSLGQPTSVMCPRMNRSWNAA